MHYRFIVCLGVLLTALSLPAGAQFPVTLTLDSRSAEPVLSPPTRPNARYRITVQGRYSQWPQFSDCRGVDAVWVYEVPQEEIDAFRWPPSSILGRPFVEIPHWVGDSTRYVFPPAGFGTGPLFELSFRKYLGFRVDGQPFPALPFDPVLHRYQQVRAGTGQPFEFRILDSTYVMQQGRAVPRHEDNCGSLTVTVEEIQSTEVNICDVRPISENGKVVGLRLDASVVEIDSLTVRGKRNVLTTKDELGIVVDGKFICPDSLSCDRPQRPVMAIGLAVDISGSMLEPISFEGQTISRMDAVKRSLRGFIRKLLPGDSLFLVAFSSRVQLVLDWTRDTNAMIAAVEGLTPTGNTALHAALIYGLERFNNHPSPNKMLVALTDGLNNVEPLSESPVLQALQAASTPLYLIALGLGNQAAELEGLASMQRFADAAPTGRLFHIMSGDELSTVYQQLAASSVDDECCRLYFRLPDCDRGQSKRDVRLVYIKGSQILTKNILLDCDLPVVSVHEPEIPSAPTQSILSASPTPASDVATIRFAIHTATDVSYEVVSLMGHRVRQAQLGVIDIGMATINVPLADLPNGMYLCSVRAGVHTQTFSIVVQR